MATKKSEKVAKEKKQAEKKAASKVKKAAAAPKEAALVDAPKEKPLSEKSKPAALKKAGKKAAISNEDIALRAYFIAERREKMGWLGDSTGDWVEAERQLKAEAARKK
ncbi:MAG: hypothetical protein ACOYM3_17455 [Terrimicrobiaceae bacterium]